MSLSLEDGSPSRECPTCRPIRRQLSMRLGGRAQDIRLLVRDGGVILQGRSRTYYAKQLAQQAVMEATDLPILANPIVVH